MAKIGYARVGTADQNDDSQVDELKAYGCDMIFVDHGVSGKHASRPELDKALACLREGDVFVVTRLSRAMRSLHQMLDLVNGTRANDYKDGFKKRNIGLKVLKQDIDTTTSQGRLIFNILAAIDEFQRELIVDGTQGGPSRCEGAREAGWPQAVLHRQPGQDSAFPARPGGADGRGDRTRHRGEPGDRLPYAQGRDRAELTVIRRGYPR